MMINPFFLTEVFDPTKAMDFADAIPYGLKTALLGMGVIFAVLIILWAVLSVFRLVFYKGGKEKTAEAVPTPVPAPEAAPAPIAPTATDDAELIAAITAAIAVVMDAPETSFRVVSFRRTAKK